MKQFKVTDGSKEFIMNLPTAINEITKDYLLNVTSDVDIAPYHAIVATVYRCRLLEIVNTNKKSRAMSVAIVPIFVKAKLGDNNELSTKDMFYNANCGDKIVIAGTDLERGYHLSIPKNFITIENVIRVYKYDNDFAKAAVTDQNHYYFADFKLVPLTDIKGFYKQGNSNYFNNPFIAPINTENQA